MTKGERLYKDMKSFEIEIVQGGEISYGSLNRGGHGHGQRGINIEEKRWIKIFGQEKHTNRGSKLMNFD